MAEEQAAAPEQAQQPVFGIEKIYIKDLSLEVPNAPMVFAQQMAPQVGIELTNAAAQIQDGVYEVSLTVTVTSKLEDKTVFLVEIVQCGIFQIRNLPAENLDMILGISCPNILFPYVREAVSTTVVRAGFAPVMLNPVNFEALFAQQRQQMDGSAPTTH
ncbi:protein-export chaperone SecB [Pseudomethylobacillus aquaticus]|uniref:Protein-export protein SecB n=1 Tax=Pseudomethylobacillus aquaticus TaxID=2676064 RepID=A0A3N0V323_9PROT|nr:MULTISPECIES: protein-export chaperone SecB [Methylophilaceae]ROH87206.1 protein-export chaperone SecB [Pseudomethylobacillus aquaticus]